jgi:Uma2 family endonuclease
MGELGWFDDKRVELIDGEIYEMSPIGSHHAVSVYLVTQALQQITTETYFVIPQSPLDAGPRSEPVPDVAVISGNIRDYTEALPQQSILVVEVSDSSLRHDRALKARLYAAIGIQEYWIVDLKAKKLIVHRHPTKSTTDEPTAEYSEISSFDSTATVAPLFAPDKTIEVGNLLP